MQRPMRAFRRCNTLLVMTRPLSSKIRSFHSSPRLQSTILDTFCSQSFELMNTLHSSTGLSWVFVLPLTAVVIRATIVVPLSIWSRVNLRKLREIQPLLLSWMPKIQKDVVRSNRGLGPAACEKIIKQEHRKKSLEIRRAFGINLWSAYAPLLQLPVFLVTIESIRQMCIGKTGLIGSIYTWISGGQYLSTIPIQTSLATEGALWFPDLLQSDPLYILPVALSGMLYANVAYNERLQRVLSTTRIQRTSRWTTALKGLAIGMLFVTPNLPAAMLVYWVSSSGFALLTTYALEKCMPVPKAMVPCRPLIKPYMNNFQSADRDQPKSALSRWVSENF